jgi:hypothetical protein
MELANQTPLANALLPMPVIARPTGPTTEPAARLIEPLAAALERRGLAAPALLFVAGHRPLAFVAGQLLAVAAPLAAVLGQTRVMDWAHLLSTPEGVDGLQAALAAECRSGNLPGGATRRDEEVRRVANPTYEGNASHEERRP